MEIPTTTSAFLRLLMNSPSPLRTKWTAANPSNNRPNKSTPESLDMDGPEASSETSRGAATPPYPPLGVQGIPEHGLFLKEDAPFNPHSAEGG